MRPRAALALLAGLVAGALAAPPCHAAPHASAAGDAGAHHESPRAADAREKAQAAIGKAHAEGQLQDLRGQLDALAQQQRENEGERSDAGKALRAADGDVGQAIRALHETRAAIAAQQTRLAQVQEQQAALAGKLASQRAQLAALVRAAYALGGDEQLKLLLAQDRVVDLARTLQYHRYLDAERLRRIRNLTDRMHALADLSRQVDAQRAALAVAQQQQMERLAIVQVQRARRGEVLARLDAAYKDRAARMQAMGHDAQALQSLVNRLTVVMSRAPPLPPSPPVHALPAPSHHPPPAIAAVAPVRPPPQVVVPFNGAPGRFEWPLRGALLAGFGGDSHGLLIAGRAGEDVHAIGDGRVAFADWLKGYGLLVIIDHGHGVMSLYANNDAVLKNAGDVVRAGDVVATVGSSGGQGRDALYFEIRQNGKPVEPRAWLRPR